MNTLVEFDMIAFYDALDADRRARDLTWYELADLLWAQSERYNQAVTDHPLCGGALSRMRQRGTTDCQYALYGLRWLGRPPEDFLTGSDQAVGDHALPDAGTNARLRFNLPALHAALNERRVEAGLTWAALAGLLGCTPARLTNLRQARQADVILVVRITQWLGLPAATFIRPVTATNSEPEFCSD